MIRVVYLALALVGAVFCQSGSEGPDCPGNVSPAERLVVWKLEGGRRVGKCVTLGSGLTIDSAGVLSAGGGSGTVTYAADLRDLQVGRTDATHLAVANCTAGFCLAKISGINTGVVGGQAISADGNVLHGGVVYIYIAADSIVHIYSTAIGVTCSGCTVDSSSGWAAEGTVQLGTWTTTAGQWDVGGGADYRAVLAGCGSKITPGTGVVVSFNPSDCSYQVAVSGSGGGLNTQSYWYPFASQDTGSGPSSASGVYTSGSVSGAVAAGGMPIAVMAATGGYVVIHHLLPSTWDGSAINATLIWSQNNGGSGSMEFKTSNYCVGAGATVSPTFANTITATAVAVPASNLMASTALAVPVTGCSAGQMLMVKIANTASGSGGTTYVSAINFHGASLLVKQ